jgi:hypothetical protein
MKLEIMANADGIDSDSRKTPAELFEEPNDVPAGIFSAPETQGDDLGSATSGLANVNNRLGFASPNVHPG